MTFEQRAGVWFVVASVGLLVGLATAQPALVAVGAAFLVPLLFGLAAQPPRLPEATVRVSSDRVIEGGRVELALTLAASDACPWLDIELRLPERLDGDGAPTRRVLALHEGETRTLEYSINCPRWGAFPIASIRLSARDQLHLRRAELGVEPTTTLRVYPSLERLRRLAGPRATRPVTGSRPAAVAGEGIEFAELRSLAPGERARRINWRATAARGPLLVNDRLPERSSEVVIFLDALGPPRRARSTLDHAVRAAASLAWLSPPARPRRSPALRRRSRVGPPRLGPRQLYRLVDAVLESEAARTHRWRDTSLIPRRVLPPQSLIVALTSRSTGTSRARSSISAAAATTSRSSRSIRSRTSLTPRPLAGPLAWRTWLLERDAVRTQLAGAGIALASWRPDEPIAAPVEALAAAR